jgi:hypothetical protein
MRAHKGKISDPRLEEGEAATESARILDALRAAVNRALCRDYYTPEERAFLQRREMVNLAYNSRDCREANRCPCNVDPNTLKTVARVLDEVVMAIIPDPKYVITKKKPGCASLDDIQALKKGQLITAQWRLEVKAGGRGDHFIKHAQKLVSPDT